MRTLLPFIILYKRHKWALILGIMLAIITLLANISLLTLSGWFLSASSIAGETGIYTFNYMLPAVAMRSASIVRTTGRYFERLVSHNATFSVLQHLRVFTFSRLIPLSPSGLADFCHSELLNCIVADIDALDQLYLRIILPLTSVLIVILITIIKLRTINEILSLTLGSITLLTLLLLPTLFYLAGKPNGENLTYLRSKYRQHLITWLHGQAELAIFGATQHYRANIDNTELKWYEAQYLKFKLSILSQTIIMLISGVTTLFILWISPKYIVDNSNPGSLIALFVFCTIALFETLAPVIGSFQHLGQIVASATRITNLIQQSPEVQFVSEQNHQIPDCVKLSLQNVSFTYDGQVYPALNDITLNILTGEHIAILGRTGCGKSTLLQLLTRAWDPQKGLISINDIPLTNFSELALRHIISVVTQRVHIFIATLRDNLLLASPNVNDLQLSFVLKLVGLHKLLEGEGLNNWLGEGGRQLSGGEIRRLAIARAILHDAPLMLLDEPTEGLDVNTESQILDLLKQIMKDKTVLMVTHRLRGLINFDRIIVMDNGQIIEEGNHLELLAKHDHYYHFQQHL